MTDQDAPSIALITIDRDSASLILSRSDGKEARFPITRLPFEESSELARLHFTPSFTRLLAVTKSGDEIVFELATNDATADVTDKRLIVYLDQNQWSAVANIRYDDSSGSPEDRDAVKQLIEWALDDKVILPASAGHYFETSKRFDKAKRYRLGLSILQLSRGWQMRDPLQVRRDELYNTFCNLLESPDKHRNDTVFTLDPKALHSESRGMTNYSAPTDFPEGVAFNLEALVQASASIDTMLDAERCEPGPDTGWTQANQAFSDWLDGQNLDANQKRKAIDAFFLNDLVGEIAEESFAAGISTSQLSDWISSNSIKEIARMPALGIFREMLHNRHLNKGTTWKPNDVTDMVYLSCAAGYADFVVCERHMREHLAHGIRRLGIKSQAFRRLSDATSAIEIALSSR
ncbi:hypothetical protein [Nonomuraea rhodomycinica]|uniref:Uncharacterized protein n=1 Tax=Nonomuraea rhodomycinica TaxID=1712872 RepID=A0A7Y6IUY1_9ACTN|nr:hypothetical protein [Nonomuraea rhodomycinica]NUW44862.1 hypothetical protein [Nonomuraea rhodomycinica]